LEGSSYYQGNRIVDNYLDSFLILTSDARYIDPQTLVIKFYQDLKLHIQNQITTMPFRRPTDTDPGAWYTAAQRINQAQLANEAFQSMLWLTTTALICSALPRSTPLSMLCSALPALLPIPPRPPLPILSRGTPMNVNTVCKMRFLPLHRCYRCRVSQTSFGHISTNSSTILMVSMATESP